MLPYGRQTISDADLKSILESLKSDWLTCGPKVTEFEAAFAEYVGTKYAVALNNATAALHLAMLVSNIGPGDRVVTSPNTFLSSANCAAFVGAIADFADIDPLTYNLNPVQLKKNWQFDTKAIVAVDYGGQTADMPAIAAVARDNGAVIIEDACHAIGGRFMHDGKSWRVGGHPWADMTTFSFHPVKTMTTGEGGMLVTDNEAFAARASLLRTHGMTRCQSSFSGLGDPAFNEQGPWYYEMQELGYNFRITDFQCALGLSQLAQVDEFVLRRREIVAAYNAAFANIDLIQTPALRTETDRNLTSWHLYTLQIDFERLGKTRTRLMDELARHGVGTQVLYIPVHLQPWYRQAYGYAVGKCPVAERFYLRALSLPLYPTMSGADVDLVIDQVRRSVR